tara:strand:- start:2233 stop:2403 length:171 start_codon:yes stop_codon:yes gene_type:complete
MSELSLEALKKKHRKLDEEIQDLIKNEPYNENLIKNKKNEKLLLKNKIIAMENKNL